jgi:DNA integrity scanning protein DisA with diadenylate cyclase activity
MINKNKTLELLDYINKPMTRESISILYAANNISYQKCELFNDFIQSLLLLVFDTYMGDDITNQTEQKNHFKWCWDKNVENFKKEEIVIGDKKSYQYFSQFISDMYYLVNKKDEKLINNSLIKTWNFILNVDNVKSKSDVDTFIEVYRMLENSLILT